MIPELLQYTGDKREFQFRDKFVMPLLLRLGFGVVLNYHGTREFGRDVIFGDIDRFGHVVYYGMQIKYESSIGLSDSHTLIQDAEQATHNPFTHPQTGRQEFISAFYIANAGDISGQARENFFNTVTRRGVRDARLLDGNALVLLDRAASINRTAQVREQLSGILQEVRRNFSVLKSLLPDLETFVQNPESNVFPILRCRSTATGHYLASPFPIEGIDVDEVDRYCEECRIINDLTTDIGVVIAYGNYRMERFNGLKIYVGSILNRIVAIDRAVSEMLVLLGKQ